MSLCVIPNCHNTKSGGYTLFKLPNEGEKSRSKWIQFIKICGVDTDDLKNEFIKAVHDNIMLASIIVMEYFISFSYCSMKDVQKYRIKSDFLIVVKNSHQNLHKNMDF
ncbi:hypothetical protein PVAND_004228 [Polypedilum vanderplanki]|uniref:THAP-type domain-containing protein n=1 Tax=Polypedilum vanderplanki TaxID=319348 RepID=A0A9J6BX22_POLVA|nr:hypothetical protein PVAND_004228 [Polypedilum vanderplanki]